MNQYTAEVVNVNRSLGGFRRSNGRSIDDGFIISFRCPELAVEAKPGQFVMVNCDEAHTLPRPFSINRVVDDTLYLYIAVLENGTGTSWLYDRQPGDTVRILGPLGNGFDLSADIQNVLLLGGGMGIAPLVFLAEEMHRKGIQTDVMYGTANNSRYPLETTISGVNAIIATEDGSEGYHGLVTDLLPEYIDKAGAVFMCGPEGMYKYLAANRDRLLKDKPVQVSLESRMACGRGICYGCTIKTKSGLRRVCENGPVFDLSELMFE